MKKNLYLCCSLLFLSASCSLEKGPQGTQGPRGFQGQEGATGTSGATGAQGLPGATGETGPTGTDGTACSAASFDGGVTLICSDGTAATLHHGAQGLNGQNGQDGLDGQNGQDGQDGNSCSTEDTDGGIFVSCTDGTSSFIAHGIKGANGRSCSAQPADGGVLLSCDDGSQAWFHNGDDGVNGNNGTHGNDGENGDDGTSCSTTETDGGARINCTDGTAAFLRHGLNGSNGLNGDDGEDGEDGDDCLITSAATGVTITCGEGDSASVAELQHGNECTVSDTGNSLSLSCGEGEGLTTSTFNGSSSIEPFGMAMINDASGSLAQNDALFMFFLSPATGLFEHFALMGGTESTDVELEITLFQTTDQASEWNTVTNSNVVSLTTPTADAYGRITGSGLNAQLTQNEGYLIGIRNLSATPWNYASYTPNASLPATQNNSAKLCMSRTTNALSTYASSNLDLDHTDFGHGKRPWFRVSQ
jgi:hypothetical protein